MICKQGKFVWYNNNYHYFCKETLSDKTAILDVNISWHHYSYNNYYIAEKSLIIQITVATINLEISYFGSRQHCFMRNSYKKA